MISDERVNPAIETNDVKNKSLCVLDREIERYISVGL